MSQNIQAWFKEVIKDKVTVLYQAHGGLLDGTMMGGDTQAHTVKFPIVGRTEVYELTGAIERVPVGGPSLTTVQVTLRDYEASDWWRTQDAYKAGPNEQAALASIIVKAVRRKRDTIKLDALAAFAAADANVETIGTGAEVPDILHFEQGRAEIEGTGAEDEVYCAIPAMWASQLSFYKEFADAQWVGLENAPFSKTQRMKMKTVRGITYIVCPNEYFSGPADDELYAYMWAKEAMGAETPWTQEAPSMSQHQEMQGSPWLIKNGLGGAAIGIQPLGVKRFHLAEIVKPVRPAVETIDVTPAP